MNDTPTPRTDERKASFALDTIRQLETELAAVTEQRDRLTEVQNLLMQCLSAMPVSYIPTHTAENLPEMIGDLAKALAEETTEREKFERELTAVTYQRDELLRYNEEFRKETLICADCDAIRKEEYDQAIEQRDEIDSMYHKIIKEVLECDQIPACQREDDQLEPPWEVIARVREQRDRLAEALKELLTTGDNGYGTPTDKAWEMAEQAIAAVEGGSDELQG